MATPRVLSDKQLDIAHDHYKETFARLLNVEAQRDRLFLWLIGLFALLILEIGYPAAVGGTLGKITIAGGELNLQSLPLPALLNVTWVMTLTVGLRYCQKAVFVNRQYDYLHVLEDIIAPELGESDLYRREGAVYLRKYPELLNAAWFAYGILFPVIVMVATVGCCLSEWRGALYPFRHRLFDTIIATALIAFFFLYQTYPAIVSGLKKWREWREHRRQEASKTKSEMDVSPENLRHGSETEGDE